MATGDMPSRALAAAILQLYKSDHADMQTWAADLLQQLREDSQIGVAQEAWSQFCFPAQESESRANWGPL